MVEAPGVRRPAPHRFRVGLLTPRFQFFDPHMLPGFADRMRAIGERCAAILGEHVELVHPGALETEADAERARRQLARQPLDAVVVAPTMAVPAPIVLTALEATDAPLVLWNPVPTLRMSEDLSQAEATENSTTVGCLMLANVFLRRGRHAEVRTAPLDDPAAIDELLRVVRGAAGAGSLRRAALLRIGDEMPTYLNVAASEADLARLGPRQITIGQEELDEAFTACDDLTAAAVVDEVRALGWVGDGGPGLERSARLAAAVRSIVDRHDAVGGTVNCHAPLLRFSDTIGIPACLAVALESTRGINLGCTGDQPVAVALLVARRLTGRALYHEPYAPEPASGLMLLAAGGEGDPGWADGPVSLESNDHYPGHRGEGTSIAFPLRLGPATMLSLSPIGDSWHLAYATGDVVESRYRNLRGPNGMFRFDSGPAVEAADRWIGSGATHHSALLPGRASTELEVAARALGIRVIADGDHRKSPLVIERERRDSNPRPPA
jgi:L-arabinose isomerase